MKKPKFIPDVTGTNVDTLIKTVIVNSFVIILNLSCILLSGLHIVFDIISFPVVIYNAIILVVCVKEIRKYPYDAYSFNDNLS
jgi:hypothetical protein